MSKISKQNLSTKLEGENLFAKQETIARLLQSIELSDYDFIRIDRTYRIDPDRNGVVVILKDRKTENLLKATIDFKHGKPSWQQMMDITFGIGEGSDIRVAVHDQPDSYDWTDDDEGEYMAESFVSILTGCGLKAYAVRMDVRLRNGRSPEIEFTVISDPETKKTSFEKLPSREEFEQAEFWLFYYDQLYPADPPRVLEPEFWFGGIATFVHSWAKTSAIWNDQGIFLEAIFKTPEEIETLKRLTETKQAQLLDHYQGCDMRIETTSEGSQKLVIRFSKATFKDFVLSDGEGKQTLADLYLYGDSEFVTVMDELVSEISKNLKSSATSGSALGNGR